jgi:hypothetical protein
VKWESTFENDVQYLCLKEDQTIEERYQQRLTELKLKPKKQEESNEEVAPP